MTAPPFSIWLDAPHSKKNGTQILKGKGGRPFVKCSNQVEAEQLAIRDAISAQLRHSGRAFEPGVLFPDDDVSVTLTVNARKNRMLLSVEHLRPRPAPFAGRVRDLHGHIETTMDAIEGLILANDNQVAELYIRRTIED